ncbi:DUF2807 domain-containing protein [Polymorphobacter glacialis]|uniref:DUF2807 domain-containing protein n=1 Tax=Sandarakinorhabdus glacialis TaxID=1614636 RepID=A0A917E927_9SPHN|nr:head GIN domain-containing protein [Polymorphobacter glacialis]GGE15987.1 DUF2807 domain-containing protein [Polymorphobacter glacialis]
MIVRLLLASALIPAAASAADRNYTVGTFDRIAVAGASDVQVITGKAISVRGSGEVAALDRLEVRVEDGELVIGNKKNSGWNWNSLGQNGKTRFVVTVPMLRAAKVAGSGDVTVDRIDTPEFGASVAGSGNLRLPSVKSATTRFSVAGSGKVAAAGTSSETRASVAGSGDLDLAALKTATLSVSVSGSGNVNAFATTTASGSVAGSGDIRIRGGAKCAISKAGSGSIDCA